VSQDGESQELHETDDPDLVDLATSLGAQRGGAGPPVRGTLASGRTHNAKELYDTASDPMMEMRAPTFVETPSWHLPGTPELPRSTYPKSALKGGDALTGRPTMRLDARGRPVALVAPQAGLGAPQDEWAERGEQVDEPEPVVEVKLPKSPEEGVVLPRVAEQEVVDIEERVPMMAAPRQSKGRVTPDSEPIVVMEAPPANVRLVDVPPPDAAAYAR
jgi:hypothetical protein